jgi:hypothetical protein
VSLDKKGNVLVVNRKSLEVLEYDTSEELIGKTGLICVFPPEINAQVKQAYSKVMSGEMERE